MPCLGKKRRACISSSPGKRGKKRKSGRKRQNRKTIPHKSPKKRKEKVHVVRLQKKGEGPSLEREEKKRKQGIYPAHADRGKKEEKRSGLFPVLDPRQEGKRKGGSNRRKEKRRGVNGADLRGRGEERKDAAPIERPWGKGRKKGEKNWWLEKSDVTFSLGAVKKGEKKERKRFLAGRRPKERKKKKKQNTEEKKRGGGRKKDLVWAPARGKGPRAPTIFKIEKGTGKIWQKGDALYGERVRKKKKGSVRTCR